MVKIIEGIKYKVLKNIYQYKAVTISDEIILKKGAIIVITKKIYRDLMNVDLCDYEYIDERGLCHTARCACFYNEKKRGKEWKIKKI